MAHRRHATAIALWLALAAAPDAGPQDEFGGPFSGLVVRDAPFSAEARTTVSQTLPDGREVVRVGVARYYRDRAGRIRVEHVISGLDPLNTAPKGQVRTIVDPDPEDSSVYTLDERTRTANLSPRFMYDQAVGGGASFALPIGGARWGALVFGQRERRWGKPPIGSIEQEPLGRRRIEGLEAVGHRLRITEPTGEFAVEERWESPELGLLVCSTRTDSRSGAVEYRLTNVRRIEPSSHLFVIPPDYSIATTGDNGSTTLFFAENQNNSTKRW